MDLRPLFLTASLSIIAALAAGCTPAPLDEPEGETSPRIVGGHEETGYDAVGYLAIGLDASSLAGPNCGATLIGPHLAITAGHCIRMTAAAAYGVGFGAAGSSPIHAAKAVYVHPDYDPNGSKGSPRYQHDMAVLVLDDAPSVTPTSVVADAPPAKSSMRYVGYGRTTAGTYDVTDGYTGERKSAAQTVTSTDGFNVWTQGVDGGLCWGDSGGPLLDGSGRVAGVLADFDGTFDCQVGNAMIFTSAAAESAFLADARACASGGACSLTAYDPSIDAPTKDEGTGTGAGKDGGAGSGADASTGSDDGTGSAGTGDDGTPADGCAFACTDYGYDEGTCYAGWYCSGGCLEENAACN